MKVKRYFATSMQESLKAIRNDLGPQAVILSSNNVDGGVEIVAALDYEEQEARESLEHEVAEQEQVTAEPSPSQIARLHAEKHVALQREMDRARRRIQDVREKRSRVASVSSSPEVLEERNLTAPSKVSEIHSAAPSDGDGISAVRSEITKLKELINSQLVQKNASGVMPQQTLLQNKLQQSLDSLTISRSIQQPLLSSVGTSVDFENAWQSIRSQLLGSIRTQGQEIIDEGGVHALVGPTGSGKTMTIGKLAARYVMRYGPESIALVTTDRYRIAAHEQLKVFGRILNVPVHAVNETSGLDDVLEKLSAKKLVLVDTAGLMHNDRCWSEQLQELKMSRFNVQCHLVVSAVGQYQVMRSNFYYYRMVGLAGCMVTKVDEAVSLGEVISFLIDSRLPISYFTDGQRVPEDLHLMTKEQIWQKAEALLNTSERWVTISSSEEGVGSPVLDHSVYHSA